MNIKIWFSRLNNLRTKMILN